MSEGRSLSRILGASLLAALAGLLGLLPARSGALEAHALASWLALVAGPLGVLAGARRSQIALVSPPLVWLAALAFANHGARGSGLPRPDLAWTAALGLYVLGAAFGVLRPAERWRWAGLFLLGLGFAAALPVGGALLGEPWPPELAARLLDVSPVGLVLECGGIDWMRDAAVYQLAGTADIGPDLRSAWRGQRAAPLLLVGTYLLYVGARARVRARAG